MTDADDFFRQDAAARGIPIPEYERLYGIQLAGGPAEGRVAYNELPAGHMTDEDVAEARHFERNFVRVHKRRRARNFVRATRAPLGRRPVTPSRTAARPASRLMRAPIRRRAFPLALAQRILPPRRPQPRAHLAAALLHHRGPRRGVACAWALPS